MYQLFNGFIYGMVMVMKTKIKLITMLAVLLSCMSANAQVSVNGIEPCQT